MGVKERMRKAREINLDEKQRAELSEMAGRGRTTQRLAQRCRIVLAAGEGMTDNNIFSYENDTNILIKKNTLVLRLFSLHPLGEATGAGFPSALAFQLRNLGSYIA
jgi:hypothetical protein